MPDLYTNHNHKSKFRFEWGADLITHSVDDTQETGGHINDADCLMALQAASELLKSMDNQKSKIYTHEKS